MAHKFLIFSIFFLIGFQCFAQEPYSHCYEQNKALRKPIMTKFHYYDKKRMDSTITSKEEAEFRKVQFDLLINNFLDWGERGRVDVNTDPYFKYYDSISRTFKFTSDWEAFNNRPDVAAKLKQRKPDSIYLKGPETFSIPEEVAKKTRFGNLDIGKSIDLYYMKPLVVFYDTAWEQSITFETGEGISKYPRGYRSFCPCKRDPLKKVGGEFYPSEYGQFEDCQFEMFKYRLAVVYDILKEDMDRLAVKGKDRRYNMFRRIRITRENCYYTVQFYKDIFESDTQTKMLNWYVNKYKNKKGGNGFTPTWENGLLLNTTLTIYPMQNADVYTEWLTGYSRKLCRLEEGKIGSKSLYLSKKFQKTPQLSALWNDGVFMDTWQIMDFGDNKPVCRRFTADGDLIMYRNPLNASYYTNDDNYHYVYNDARPFYKSYSKQRRFLYYSILRYPESSIRRRIDYVTHQ